MVVVVGEDLGIVKNKVNQILHGNLMIYTQNLPSFVISRYLCNDCNHILYLIAQNITVMSIII